MVTKSYLKYLGSKRRLVGAIAQYVEPYRDHPFWDVCCGSAAVGLGLGLSNVTAIDINPHIINLHQQVQNGALDQINALPPFSREQYLERRLTFNRLIRCDPTTKEAALCLYHLNRASTRGMIRFNKSGGFNAPYGDYGDRCVYKTSLEPWKQAFKGWRIQCRHYSDISIPDGAFVYVDPPYDSVTESDGTVEQLALLDGTDCANGNGFTNYFGDFTWADQVAIARQLAQHNGPALISNNATPRILELYESLGFKLETKMVRHQGKVKGGDRPLKKEVLAFRY